jgi:hypothetical protein
MMGTPEQLSVPELREHVRDHRVHATGDESQRFSPITWNADQLAALHAAFPHPDQPDPE